MDRAAFDKTTPEKRLAVINAGLLCFGKNGFEKTSMAQIAKEAGVSKAALFHYFGTKEQLYRFLFAFAGDEVYRHVPRGTEDFFESLALGTEAKLEVISRYPGMDDFLAAALTDPAPIAGEIRESLTARGAEEAARTLFARVDWSVLRDDVSPEDAVRLVTWISGGFFKAEAARAAAEKAQRPREELIAEVYRYFGILKRAIYREELL